MSRQHRGRPANRGWQGSVWGSPIALAVLSAVGLSSALLGDGFWDTVSWFGLGIPVVVCLWYGLPLRRKPVEVEPRHRD